MNIPPATLREHPDNARIYGDSANDDLIESIRTKGILTPLLITRDQRIISGHRRWQAAMELGLATVPVTFFESDEELDILEALIEANNQRVKTNEQLGREFQELKRIEAERARIRQIALAGTRSSYLPQNFAEGTMIQGESRNHAAAKLGISGFQGEKIVKALTRIDDLRANGDEEAAEALREALNKSAHKAHQTMRRMDMQQEIAAVESANTTLPVGERKYRIIYADPPWSYGNMMPPNVGVPQDHYPQMTLDDIMAMAVRDLAMDNSILFLWVPVPLLPEGLQVCNAWGFTYKTHMIWDKVKHNIGHYSSVRHELLFVATRGAGTPDVLQLHDSVYVEERTAHSAKPAYFRDWIDMLYPTGSRIELFARGTRVEGWDHYGNQATAVC